mmetsp:Transcript_17347/g.69730  ORF Transcript_17347/g.69730 Transcript_17347/m.69730 type:complete len:158 (-) Transcript_17347:1376-1849(-)
MPSGRAASSSWLPSSTMRPSDRTAIASALRTVERRCATRTTVEPPRAMSASSDCCTLASDSASSALVASSRSKILGLRRKARAIEMRCFWPPEMRTPRSPMRVSYSCGNCAMNSSASAALAASRHARSAAVVVLLTARAVASTPRDDEDPPSENELP